jgi:hypothetical protein
MSPSAGCSSGIGLRLDVCQWIHVIGTKAPIGDRVFGGSHVHRLVQRVLLAIADKLAAIGESFEEETIHPFGDQ